MPSFTNPNNLSIITGRPPAVHGIAGNYFFDPRRGQGSDDERREVPARADASCRPSSDAGARSPSSPPRTSCARCSARASTCRPAAPSRSPRRRPTRRRVAENGIDDVLERWSACRVPDVYSPDLSEFVFAAGVKMMRARAAGPDVSLDHRLHAAQGAPGSPMAQRVLRHDGPLRRRSSTRRAARARAHRRSRHERQASAERRARRDLSAGRLSTPGWARTRRASSCRSPIPMSCITARSAPSPRSICRTAPTRRAADQAARDRRHRGWRSIAAEACERFELPADRLGDIVVVSTKHKVLGTARGTHDLSRPHRAAALAWRAHRAGGADDRQPQAVTLPDRATLRNFDIFDVALNHVAWRP